MLEKPIGHDLASAREINATLGAALDESRIFRIDHYLGKAPVQNLLALRFGNTLMEAVWQHRWIESVDILVAETAGVDGREGYYAHYGALRDMVQNHMLQLLALIAMEPPAALDADSIRDEKTKVLRALRPMTAADVGADSVRGRYGNGVVDGEAVKGFTHDSDVETFVALRALHRQLALGRRAVPPGHRQAHALAHDRGRGLVQAGLALGVRTPQQAARAPEPPAHAPAAGGERSNSA